MLTGDLRTESTKIGVDLFQLLQANPMIQNWLKAALNDDVIWPA
jgi:hypothetical protein